MGVLVIVCHWNLLYVNLKAVLVVSARASQAISHRLAVEKRGVLHLDAVSWSVDEGPKNGVPEWSNDEPGRTQQYGVPVNEQGVEECGCEINGGRENDLY